MAKRLMLMVSSAILLTAGLSACRQGEDRAALQTLDDGLASNDPAVKAAINGEIMVDPALARQSNRNAASAGARPVDGGVPTARGGGTAAEAEADARRALAGGQLMRLPAPGQLTRDCTDCEAQRRPATLGELAEQQTRGGCNARITYDLAWARRLPETFPVYPRAALQEAAGVSGAACNIRVVNFQSRVALDSVLAWYYTRARRAGFTAEHVVEGNDHYVGGTRGDDAYVVIARNLGGGIIDVDLVTTGGR